METIAKTKYIYWQDDNVFLGYLQDYPDYWTQGYSLEELQQNLLDIYHEFTTGNIPYPITKFSQPIPRHQEINENLAKHIIKMFQNP